MNSDGDFKTSDSYRRWYQEIYRDGNISNGFHASSCLGEIKNFNPRTVFDLGTGDASFPQWCEANLKNVDEIVCSDWEHPYNLKSKKITFIKRDAADGYKEYANSSFELVTSFDFMEHMFYNNVDQIIEEMVRLTSKLIILKISFKQSEHIIEKDHKGRTTKSIKVHNIVKPKSWWEEKIENVVGTSIKKGNLISGKIKYDNKTNAFYVRVEK